MLNRVQFIGHLGRDPEVRYMASGEAVCNFPVASTERWKDKNSGEQKEATEWLKVSAFGRQAEICGEYLKKGSLVLVEGKLKTRKYDKDGVEHYATDCQLSLMKMLSGRTDRDGSIDRQAAESSRVDRAAQQAPAKAAGGSGNMDDDIPF